MPNPTDRNIQQLNTDVKLTQKKRGRRGLSSQAGQFSRPFVQLQKRHLLMNPVYLPDEDRFSLFYSDSYRKTGYAYVLIEMSSDNKPVNAHLFRTYETARNIDDAVREKSNRLLLHPYPVKIPAKFWERWKKAETPQDRIKLIKDAKLLTDEAIYIIDRIIIDIDKPFEYAKPKLEKVFAELGITQGYEIGRTKSDNLRAVVYLYPLRIKDHNGKDRVVKDFYLMADTEFRGKKHIDRYRELLYILYEMTRKEDIPLDRTFIDRVNHPVWFSYDDRFYKREERIQGGNRLYDIYKKAKKWQEKHQAYTILGTNLTKKFWKYLWKEKQQKKTDKITLPAFMLNKINAEISRHDTIEYWKRAVKSLYMKTTSNKYTKLISPAIGWAKNLGLDEWEVNRFLMSLLSDRDSRKNEKDIKSAWKNAPELEFHLPERKLPSDYATITQDVINYIKTRKEVKRQELLKNVFNNQVWLLEKVMNWLESQGIVLSRTESQGRGRPSKIYYMEDFSQNKNSLFRESNDSGLVVDGQIYSPLSLDIPRYVVIDINIQTEEKEDKKELKEIKQKTQKEKERQKEERQKQNIQIGWQVIGQAVGQAVGQETNERDFSHNKSPDRGQELLEKLQELIYKKRQALNTGCQDFSHNKNSSLEQAIHTEEGNSPQQLAGSIFWKSPKDDNDNDGWDDRVTDIIADFL